jgi:hypothetical protein
MSAAASVRMPILGALPEWVSDEGRARPEAVLGVSERGREHGTDHARTAK